MGEQRQEEVLGGERTATPIRVGWGAGVAGSRRERRFHRLLYYQASTGVTGRGTEGDDENVPVGSGRICHARESHTTEMRDVDVSRLGLAV